MARQLDRLTEQERSLLRLLAQGHTAKTIATAEGLSVNIVNERLRSARRKTGAVSSRELARLVGGEEQRLPPENRDKLFGVERTWSNQQASQQGPASTVGSKMVRRTAMIVGFLAAAGFVAYVTSVPETPAQMAQYFSPSSRGVAAVREWQVMSSSAKSPAITYLVPSSDNPHVSIPTVILSCRTVSLDVRVWGFTPGNSWPQPTLTTRIGSIERTGSPVVTASGRNPALGYSFAIADDVLEPLRRGEPISFEFNNATVAVPTIPEALRREFVQRCESLVHPGMRSRGAASSRVY